jgi:hypothetical protein
MNEKIMNWSSNAVYKGLLQADESVAHHCIADLRDNK